MKTYPDAEVSPSLKERSEEDIKRIISESRADAIIHTAAISDIGVCEKNPGESYYANTMIPEFIAKAAGNKKLICFSSDQVYSGLDYDGPYTEEKTAPSNTYSVHKLEMEKRVLDIKPDAVCLRAEWMYGFTDKKPNYFMNIINAVDTVAFSSKQYRGITYVKEAADNIGKAVTLPGGVYNYGSETGKSMYEITKDFISAIGADISLQDAPSRHNLWLDCSKAKKHGICFSDVLGGLMRCYEETGGRSLCLT